MARAGTSAKAAAERKVAPKRRPQQARSQETVERILTAGMDILSRAGIESLTTNRIAEVAGLSVASVYQFFPNKLAVVNELYGRWLAEIDARVEVAIAAHGDNPDWRHLVGAIANELGRFTLPSRAELELIRAMWSHRDLLDLDRKRNQALSTKVAVAFAPHAPHMDKRALIRLASFANEIFTLVAYLDTTQVAADREHFNQLARSSFLALWASAFEP